MWITDLFATAEEIKEIREAHQRTITRKRAIKEDRDKLQMCVNALADTNVHLAHKLEQSEMLNRQASRLIIIQALTAHSPRADDWLERYDALQSQ